MKDFHIISILTSFAIASLTLLFVLLLSTGPLEQNRPARAIVAVILNNDPKVQRNIAKGHMTDHAQTTTEILFFLNKYKLYPLVAIGVSILMNILSLLLLKQDHVLASKLLLCAAITSCFTILPSIIQAISGIYLGRKHTITKSLG